MKNELFYPGSSIREQIKAGGADDWQLRLGHYVVSLRYVTPERRGALSRLAGIFCRSERLAAVVYRRLQDGRLEAMRQITVPARRANMWTDGRTEMRVSAQHGRMCAFAVSALRGPEFIGGRWGLVASDVPLSDDERRRGVTVETERWVSLRW